MRMKYKSQMRRINEFYIGFIVVIISAMLVMSGVAVSKINTEYMDTGVKAARIVAERENEEILVSMNGRKFSAPRQMSEYLQTAARLLPAPLNGIYFFFDEIFELIK